MHIGFLLPLFTGLITGYIWKRSADEVAKLLGVACVICLVLSLIIAPWQLQVLLLASVLIGTKKLLSSKT
jgi:hypothetical protein